MRTITSLTLVAILVTIPAAQARAIPAFARKYNANCSMCHYPAVPRLNATGMRFKWAGYRMPDEWGQKVDVGQVSNYVAARGRLRYLLSGWKGKALAQSTFKLNDATLFYGGPLGRGYAAWFEFEREAEDEVGVNFAVSSAWGSAKSFGGLRAGNFHYLTKAGLAGLDRPVGINGPIPTGKPLTTAIPFAFPDEQLGAEAFYVRGRNRLSVQALQGINRDGETPAIDGDTRKDAVVMDQFLIDDLGSGIVGAVYYGSIVGLDTLRAGGLDSHFLRLVASANKIVGDFEALGGFVYGKDYNLPTRLFPADVKGLGYWFSGQYTMPRTSLTLFGRYEFLDPNTEVAEDAARRYVGGVVLPLSKPEYLRLAAEYWLDAPQAVGSLKKHNVAAEVMINF